MKARNLWSSALLTAFGLLIVLFSACSTQQTKEYTGMKMNEKLIRALINKGVKEIKDLGDLIAYHVPFERTIELMNDTGGVVLTLDNAPGDVQVYPYVGEGLIGIQSSEGIAFVNKEGVFVVPFGKYRDATWFINGVAVVYDDKEHVGAINMQGEMIVPFVEYNTTCIVGERIVFIDKNSCVTAYDNKGKKLHSVPEYQKESLRWCILNLGNPFLDRIFFKAGSKWYIWDKEGNEKVIDVYHISLNPSRESTCLVEMKNKEELVKVIKDGHYGFINYKGETVIPWEYDEVGDLDIEDDDLIVLKKNGKWGVLDTEGKEVWPFVYDKIDWASRTMLTSIDNNGNSGTSYKNSSWCNTEIRDTASWVICGSLGEYALVALERPLMDAILHGGDRNGYFHGIVNPEGKLVVPCQYRRLKYNKDLNIAFDESSTDWVYFDLDNDGKQIWEDCLVYLEGANEHKFFDKGVEIVNAKGYGKNGHAVVKRDGTFLVPFGKQDIERVYDFFVIRGGFTVAGGNGYVYGDKFSRVIDVDGNEILNLPEYRYSTCRKFLDGFYLSNQKEGWTYFITRDGNIFSIQEGFDVSDKDKKE